MENKKLTICFFGDAKKEDVFTLRWARYFADKGHNVHLISYTEAGDRDVGNIKIHVIRKKISTSSILLNRFINLPLLMWDVKNLIKIINPDVINSHCVTSYGTLAALSGFHPFISTAWGSDILINPKRNWFAKLSVKWILDKADLITCDANHMKKAMSDLGADEKKIKIIYFGVKPDMFFPGEKNDGLVKDWGFEKSDKIIFSLRNLEPIYRIETLIKAIPIVIKKFPSAKFVIAGKGSMEETLKKMADDLGVSGNIRFIGWINRDNLLKYLQTANIYVSTSLSDAGLSSSTAEAMLSGLPVVITNSGENTLWVKNNFEGFVVPVKDPESLAEKIKYFLENPDERKRMGILARKKIEEKNNYYNEMSRMEQIYYQLTNNNK